MTPTEIAAKMKHLRREVDYAHVKFWVEYAKRLDLELRIGRIPKELNESRTA